MMPGSPPPTSGPTVAFFSGGSIRTEEADARVTLIDPDGDWEVTVDGATVERHLTATSSYKYRVKGWVPTGYLGTGTKAVAVIGSRGVSVTTTCRNHTSETRDGDVGARVELHSGTFARGKSGLDESVFGDDGGSP